MSRDIFSYKVWCSAIAARIASVAAVLVLLGIAVVAVRFCSYFSAVGVLLLLPFAALIAPGSVQSVFFL